MRIIDRLAKDLSIPEGKPVEVQDSHDTQRFVDLVTEYLDMELNLAFQLNPEKCFNFGRKMRRKYSMTLKEVEETVNNVAYEVLKKRSGEIRGLLCHPLYDSYLGYFVSGLYHDIIKDKVLTLTPKVPGMLVSTRVGFCWGFGFRHPGGNLTIEGYAGGHLGEEMEDGRIVVTGYTGDEVGKGMKGGEILIRGNVSWRLGDSMESGKIIVFGNAGQYVGIGMKGGTIKIKGRVSSFGQREGGKIFLWKEGGWKEIE